jgi:hypothetical protein
VRDLRASLSNASVVLASGYLVQRSIVNPAQRALATERAMEGTTMTKTIKLREEPDMYIEATLDAFTAKPLVVIDSDEDMMVKDIYLSPIEAERLGKALIAAAGIARRKAAKR